MTLQGKKKVLIFSAVFAMVIGSGCGVFFAVVDSTIEARAFSYSQAAIYGAISVVVLFLVAYSVGVLTSAISMFLGKGHGPKTKPTNLDTHRPDATPPPSK